MAAEIEASTQKTSGLQGEPFASPPFGPTRYPFNHPAFECPACGSAEVCRVTSKSLDWNYLCEACGRCWSTTAGGAVRVMPLGCPGCSHRDTCFARLRAEIPACWWQPVDQ